MPLHPQQSLDKNLQRKKEITTPYDPYFLSSQNIGLVLKKNIYIYSVYVEAASPQQVKACHSVYVMICLCTSNYKKTTQNMWIISSVRVHHANKGTASARNNCTERQQEQRINQQKRKLYIKTLFHFVNSEERRAVNGAVLNLPHITG